MSALKVVVAGLAVFGTTSFATAASAFDIGITFGGTKSLCLTVESGPNSSTQVFSDVCGAGSSQELGWDSYHVTWVNGSGTTLYMTDHGSYVSMDPFTGSSYQSWTGDGSNLISNGTNNCLDVYQNNSGHPVKMDTYTCNGQLNQSIWLAGPDGSHSLLIYNYNFNQCLAEFHGLFGNNYEMKACSATDTTQLFVLTNNQQVKNIASGNCMGLNTSLSNLPTPVSCSTGTDTGWSNPQWWNSVTHVYEKLNNLGPAGCLDVNSSSGEVEYDACGSNSSPNYSQFWIPEYL